MMLLFYRGNWDVTHGYVEQYEVDGQPLVERYPWTRYLLG